MSKCRMYLKGSPRGWEACLRSVRCDPHFLRHPCQGTISLSGSWKPRIYSWLGINIHNLLNYLEKWNKCIIYESVYNWSHSQSILINLCQNSDYGNSSPSPPPLSPFLSPVIVSSTFCCCYTRIYCFPVTMHIWSIVGPYDSISSMCEFCTSRRE